MQRFAAANAIENGDTSHDFPVSGVAEMRPLNAVSRLSRPDAGET